MKSKIINSVTPEDTFAAGKAFGAELLPGDVVLLKGELGAGKTLFSKGVADALGFDIDEVTSPSFTLVNLYRTETIDIYHIDLWRLPERTNAGEAVGIDEILEQENTVILIEWPERMSDEQLGERLFEVSIKGDGEDARTISIEQKM